MQESLILLHEESLRITHPVFNVAPMGSRVIYVWDDAYFQRTEYTLKRLIFIYETLSEMGIDILYGDTLGILQEIKPKKVYMPYSNNPLILKIIDSIREVLSLEIVEDTRFIDLHNMEFKRFFQYWNKIEKKVFFPNGGLND